MDLFECKPGIPVKNRFTFIEGIILEMPIIQYEETSFCRQKHWYTVRIMSTKGEVYVYNIISLIKLTKNKVNNI
jgi:acetamidase/formamidase